jgi:sodium pump decarboxylase gamma subunit
MQELGLMERFANPTLFDSLTWGEKITASLVTTLMGMGVTFSILLLLWAVIAIMARILRAGNHPKKNKVEVATTVTEPNGTAMAIVPEDLQTQSGFGPEVIAVIMAAIAAQEGTNAVNNLVIRKINRVSGGQTAWRSAGSAECIDSRRL